MITQFLNLIFEICHRRHENSVEIEIKLYEAYNIISSPNSSQNKGTLNPTNKKYLSIMNKMPYNIHLCFVFFDWYA